MTVPPGGPYGQDPSGPNPYGQDPYWGGQPQSGQYPYPQGGQYPYPPGGQPGGQHPYPPGGAYPYPPPGGPYPYPPPGGEYQYPPSGEAGYPPQPGQQYPPGWQSIPYPPAPPPGGPRSKMPWFILGGVALVGVIALVVILMVGLTRENKPTSGPSGSTAMTSAPTSQPVNSDQNATDCTPNVSGGEKPPGDTIAAGKLSFPTTAAPGWTVYSDDQNPNLIGALGVTQPVPNSSQWAMTAEVAITNFVPSMDVTAQASKLMDCVAAGPGYANASPTLGPKKTSSTTVDGVNAARVDADITIAPDPSRNVKGDSVVIIAVDTKPITIFMGGTPIGDAASAGIVKQVIAALRVTKS